MKEALNEAASALIQIIAGLELCHVVSIQLAWANARRSQLIIGWDAGGEATLASSPPLPTNFLRLAFLAFPT
jgi:hypothetical protein